MKRLINTNSVQTIKCKLVNCYLLTGDNGSILIDAGNPGEGDMIISAIGNRKVNLILLTHGHNDHCGAAEYLRDKLGIPIAMSGNDIKILRNPSESVLHGHTFLGKTLAKASVKNLANTPPESFEPDILCEDNYDLSRFGVNARVVALPGHTAGSIGVFTQNGELFAGDTVFNLIRPTSARHYENREAMEISIEKIRSLGAEIIYVGHGGPVKPADIK